MSMSLCESCRCMVDTDADPDCWLETKYEDKCYCESCRNDYENERPDWKEHGTYNPVNGVA